LEDSNVAATLDPRKAHLTRYHGDIAAVYSWLNDERALFLIPHLRPGAPWFVVQDNVAYEWDDSDPAFAPNVARKAAHACEVLGIEPTPRNAMRIASIIIEGIPDLIRMPSRQPDPLGAAIGEVQIRANGELIGGEEIRLPVESGVTFDTDTRAAAGNAAV
jgi:hypothetical protein